MNSAEEVTLAHDLEFLRASAASAIARQRGSLSVTAVDAAIGRIRARIEELETALDLAAQHVAMAHDPEFRNFSPDVQAAARTFPDRAAVPSDQSSTGSG